MRVNEKRRSTEKARFATAWTDHPAVTPRQAYAVAGALEFWADTEPEMWLDDQEAPLHKVAPFSGLDLRVMILVNECRSWVAKASERCLAVATDLSKGIPPFDRPGCFFDELLMAL